MSSPSALSSSAVAETPAETPAARTTPNEPRRLSFPVGGVQIFDDAIPNDLATALHQALHLYGWTYGWLSNHLMDGVYGHWNRTFAGRSKDHRDDVTSDIRVPAVKAAWNAIASLIGNQATLIRCYSNAHTYGVEGYVHEDSAVATDVTAILYLNQEWDANDGGELIFLDPAGEISGAVLPKWNRLVTFPGTIPHAARSLSRRSKHARICLVFKTKTVAAAE